MSYKRADAIRGYEQAVDARRKIRRELVVRISELRVGKAQWH
jgi:hypothetical protein